MIRKATTMAAATASSDRFFVAPFGINMDVAARYDMANSAVKMLLAGPVADDPDMLKKRIIFEKHVYPLIKDFGLPVPPGLEKLTDLASLVDFSRIFQEN